MTSQESQRKFRVGFWLGDASLDYGGIGPYAFRILHALLAEHEVGWHFVLLCDSNVADKLAPLAAKHAEFVEIGFIPPAPRGVGLRMQQARRTVAKASSFFGFGAHAASSWHYLHKWIDDFNLDLLHFPTQTILHRDLQVRYGVTMDGVQGRSQDRLQVPYIVTMHDVQELHFPENFSPLTRAVRAVHYWKALEGARKVVVSFQHVKQDLTRLFRISPDKIHVCPIPFKSISLPEPTPMASQAYAKKYASWIPFLLYPSYTWPHKNHVQLLRALREVKRSGFESLCLICPGGTDHPYYCEIVEEIKVLSLSNSVLFTGIVPEDELRWLYQRAALVTIPTRYEAGSFPLYEAMLLGAAVICSSVTSLPETIGDPRFAFDPQNVEELANLIIHLLADDKFREANQTNCTEQCARLRRISAGGYLFDTYRSALQLPTPTVPDNS